MSLRSLDLGLSFKRELTKKSEVVAPATQPLDVRFGGFYSKTEIARKAEKVAEVAPTPQKKALMSGALVSKSALLVGAVQKADSMEEDPSVDTIKQPTPLDDEEDPKKDKLKRPGKFSEAQNSPMNTEAIQASLDNAN